MLCDHLEGWDREGGREGDARGKRYGNVCICIIDSLCYKAETNTPLVWCVVTIECQSNYTPIKMLKKKKRSKVRDIPGGPVGKNPRTQCRGPAFDPWSGN